MRDPGGTRRALAGPVAPAPAPAALPAPAGATSCGGEALGPKPGGGTWTCTFDDEFNASTGDPAALNTNLWTPQVTASSGYSTGPLGEQVCYVDSPETISVSGGALHLSVRKVAQPFNCGGLFSTQYIGGMVSTWGHFAQTYGRFEVRALLPQTAVQGLQETLWLWPQHQVGAWPGSGEIDFSEFYSLYDNLDVPFLHYDFASSTLDSLTGTNVDTSDCRIDPSVYNDYAVVWEPGSLTISVNDSTCLVDHYDSLTGGATPFDQPFIIALTQALGIGTNAFVPGMTPLPATTSIQYVRAWS